MCSLTGQLRYGGEACLGSGGHFPGSGPSAFRLALSFLGALAARTSILPRSRSRFAALLVRMMSESAATSTFRSPRSTYEARLRTVLQHRTPDLCLAAGYHGRSRAGTERAIAFNFVTFEGGNRKS